MHALRARLGMLARRASRLLAAAAIAGAATVGAGTAAAHNDGSPAPNGASPWNYAESYQITTWYNEGLHVDWHNQYGHINEAYALDWNLPCGKRLYGIWDGMTVSAVNGDVIEMQKTIGGQRYRVRYRHLNQVNVGVGATVGTTTVVGYSGNRGISTGCHLHVVVHRLHADGWWYSVPPQFCGRTYPHDHATWFKGC